MSYRISGDTLQPIIAGTIEEARDIARSLRTSCVSIFEADGCGAIESYTHGQLTWTRSGNQVAEQQRAAADAQRAVDFEAHWRMENSFQEGAAHPLENGLRRLASQWKRAGVIEAGAEWLRQHFSTICVHHTS